MMAVASILSSPVIVLSASWEWDMDKSKWPYKTLQAFFWFIASTFLISFLFTSFLHFPLICPVVNSAVKHIFIYLIIVLLSAIYAPIWFFYEAERLTKVMYGETDKCISRIKENMQNDTQILT